TYASNNIGAIFSLGGEDTDIQNSEVSAFAGGHDVVLSATNTAGGGVSSTGETLDQPNTTNVISNAYPVSMQHSNVRSSILYTAGGSLSSAAPAAGLYLDAPNSVTSLADDGIENSNIQLTGYNDIAVWDGTQGSSGGIIPSLAVRHVLVECLNNAGNGHCQAIKLGNNAPRADLSIQHNAAQQLSRTGADGVTDGTTTFTSATAAFTSADVGSAITIAGASGIPPGSYIASVTNSTTVILSSVAGGSGTGLTWVVSVPVAQFYNKLPISTLGLSDALGSGPSVACANGVGSQISLSGSLTAPSCPGATVYPDAGAAQVVQQASNVTVGMVLRPYQDYGTRSGLDLQCTNAAGSQTLCDIDTNGNANFNSWEAVKLGGVPGPIGTNYCQMFVVQGTGSACNIEALCGTSTTPTVIATNVGSGC
ncbi:MAG TPA: hypothetical protein VN742_07215, partial [Candidatus Binataceae bacterium]|nr:hypothetical protein [Candidatus Binataceae bacterium]